MGCCVPATMSLDGGDGGRDHLLRRRFPGIAGRLRLGSQRLHGVHHVRLLREECVAELLGPVEFVAHHLERLRHRGQRFDARIPGLALHLAFECLALNTGILLRPSRGFDNFERIGRGHQNLAEQRVWIERDRRHELLDLGFRKLLVILLIRRRGRRIDRLRVNRAAHGTSDRDDK